MKNKIEKYVSDKVFSPNFYLVATLLLGLYYISYIRLYYQNPPFWLYMLGVYNLGIHEMGHFLAVFFPEIITVMAGSGFEIIFVLLVLYACVSRKCYFAAGVTLIWLSNTLFQVARYVADARLEELPLVSLGNLSGEMPTGDWTYILGRFNLLEYDLIIARVLRGMGVGIGLLGLLLCSYLVFKMYQQHQRKLIAQDNKQPQISETLYPTPEQGWLAERPEDKQLKK